VIASIPSFQKQPLKAEVHELFKNFVFRLSLFFRNSSNKKLGEISRQSQNLASGFSKGERIGMLYLTG